MLKNLHGKVYYIEVESYEEADKIIEIFQSIPTFARNCIGITTGYDTDDCINGACYCINGEVFHCERGGGNRTYEGHRH